MAVLRKIPVGDLALRNHSPYFVDGPEYTRQKLSARFKFFKGEWFMNRLEGVPYYQAVFVYDPDVDVITSLFKRVIEHCPGIVGLRGYSMSFDASTRTATFSFQAKCTDGEIVVKPGDADFVLDLNSA